MVGTLPGYFVDADHVEYLVKEPVSSFKLAPGCEAGDGVASALKSITVNTKSGQVLQLIHKSLDEEDQAPKEMAQHSFKTEILIYETLIPKLQNLATSRGVSDPLPVPKFFGGSMLPEAYLCMEDVRPQGFQMKDKFTGLDLDETGLVMMELAKFHALTYLLIKWEGEKIFEAEGDLEQLSPTSLMMELMRTEGHKMFTGTMANAIAIMEKRNPELSAKMKLLQEADVKTILDTNFKTDTVFFPVIVHGDIWLNNILFKCDSSGFPTDLKFIDFQHSRRGNIFEDLQYFVFTSTTPDFRKKYLYQILNTYFDSFMATLERLNFPAPCNFTRGFFLDSFQKCYLPIYRYMTFAIPLQLGAPKNVVMEMMMQHAGNQKEEGDSPNDSYGSGNGKDTSMPEMDPYEMLLAYSRLAMESSPAAVERLESITQELVDLKLI